jgi:hypothetical protein
VWTIFIAHGAGVSLSWTFPAAMFLAVWMVYAMDRLLDARSLDIQSLSNLEERHLFHYRYRNGFLSCIALAAVLLVLLLPRLDPQPLRVYAVLSALLAGWLLLIHRRPLPNGKGLRLPKELAVGLFFSATVFLATISTAPALWMALLPVAALFAAVCALNGFYIHAWEYSGACPGAHWTARWSTRYLGWLSFVVAALATVELWLGRERPFPFINSVQNAPLIACALSALLLFLLHGYRQRISTIHLRVYADLVLLTPLLWLPCQWGWLHKP